MTDYNTDQARELRRARLTVIRPTNALATMSRADFNRVYKEQHVVVREAMPDCEESERAMFCPACQEQVDDTLVAVRKLYTTYEEDPLRNYRALVTVCCKGCGWSEIIPVDSPPPLSEDDAAASLEANRYKAKDQMDQMRNAYMQGGPMNPDVRRNDMERMLAKQSMLGQMYGAGPKVMKSLMSGKIGNITGVTVAEMGRTSTPRRGQALADSIWQDYDSRDKQRAEAAAARDYVANRKIHEQYMNEAAAQMAKAIDKEVMDELTKMKPGAIMRAPKPKYAVAPSPAPKPYTLDDADKAEMRRQLEEAVKRADGDPTKLSKLYAQVRDFFR